MSTVLDTFLGAGEYCLMKPARRNSRELVSGRRPSNVGVEALLSSRPRDEAWELLWERVLSDIQREMGFARNQEGPENIMEAA